MANYLKRHSSCLVLCVIYGKVSFGYNVTIFEDVKKISHLVSD